MTSFSKTEIKDLSIAIIVITLIFTFIFERQIGYNIESFLFILPMALITVGLSFVLHELGHKIVAQKYGFYAEFRRSDKGLALAMITALIGFVFLAPGVVYIGTPFGYITEEQNGKISIAGPLVNIALALIFYVLLLTFTPLMNNDLLSLYIVFTSTIGFHINGFLALFNLLPIGPLDGLKVLRWNKLIWLATIAIAGIITYISYF